MDGKENMVTITTYVLHYRKLCNKIVSYKIFYVIETVNSFEMPSSIVCSVYPPLTRFLN
jgi:hypothetical protein